MFKFAITNIRKSTEMIPENEYAPYYANYIQSIEKNGKSIIDNLYDTKNEFESSLRILSSKTGGIAYAEGKWTINEVLQHIIDTERVFCYRALCFARNDTTALPGFDQDYYVDYSFAKQRDYYDLLDEMEKIRESTILFFESLTEEALLRIGTASGTQMSVRAIGFLLSGHQMHHLKIIKERYL